MLYVIQQTVEAAHKVDYPLAVFVNSVHSYYFGFSGYCYSISFIASGSYRSSLESRFFPPVLHDGDDTLHILRTVIRLVVDLRISQRAVVAQGLQRAWADVEASGTRPDCPSTRSLSFLRAAADGIHAADETVELGDHRLKGLSFDRYDFHILFV